MAKTMTLLLSMIIILLNFADIPLSKVGLSVGCAVYNRFIFQFFHVNALHLILNLWCYLSMVFLRKISLLSIIVGFMCGATIPINTMYRLGLYELSYTSVGLSALCYFLFGRVSLQVSNKLHYFSWVAIYIAIGFAIPSSSGFVHLYNFVCGLVIAIIKYRSNG